MEIDFWHFVDAISKCYEEVYSRKTLNPAPSAPFSVTEKLKHYEIGNKGHAPTGDGLYQFTIDDCGLMNNGHGLFCKGCPRFVPNLIPPQSS